MRYEGGFLGSRPFSQLAMKGTDDDPLSERSLTRQLS